MRQPSLDYLDHIPKGAVITRLKYQNLTVTSVPRYKEQDSTESSWQQPKSTKENGVSVKGRMPIMSAKLLSLDREMQSSSSDELQVALCSGLQHSGLAEQSRGIVGSSGTSTSVSSVMSLMTKEVVEWNEDPKQ
ncbi:hypothetical protein STEG23_014422, partial [Scotinomys teguina]